jgi:hypothetical protein
MKEQIEMTTQHSLEIELDYCVRMASRYANYYDFLPRAITVARRLNWQQTAIALENYFANRTNRDHVPAAAHRAAGLPARLTDCRLTSCERRETMK